MKLMLDLLIGIIALEHLYFLWLEMFAWETTGKKVFKKALPEHMFTPTKILAANQGLYNGFLAAALLWTYSLQDPTCKHQVSFFILACISVAGIYGALTADRKIFYIQALPALIALILMQISNS